MANVKVAPSTPKGKQPGRSKAKAKPTAAKLKKALDDAKRSNSGTYCFENGVKWHKDDNIKKLSQSKWQYVVFTVPPSDEEDTGLRSHFDDCEEMEMAKGATYYNQIKCWYIREGSEKVGCYYPSHQQAIGNVVFMAAEPPDNVAQYGMWYTSFDQSMDEEEMMVLFRQYFPEMQRDPEARGVLMSKLPLNMEATVEEQLRCVRSFFFNK